MKIDLPKLKPAEKRLLVVFLGIFLLLFHLLGLRLLWKAGSHRREELVLLRAEKKMVEALVADAAFWQPRQEWLALHLPPRTGETKKVLDGKMEEIGKEYTLNPPRGVSSEETGEFYDVENYNTTLSGKWSDLIEAMQKLHLPNAGIVITSLDIRALDEKIHSASVTLSRFFMRNMSEDNP